MTGRMYDRRTWISTDEKKGSLMISSMPPIKLPRPVGVRVRVRVRVGGLGQGMVDQNQKYLCWGDYQYDAYM